MSETFVSPCELPTAREREILDILIEECAEVIQRATKMKRFGVTETQPGQPHDNVERLSYEFGDLLEIAAIAEREGLLKQAFVDAGRISKQRQLARFMQTRKTS